MESQSVDWSALLSELLKSISDRLPSRFDIQKFRAVCRAWRSSTPEPIDNSLPSFLSLPTPESENRIYMLLFYLYQVRCLQDDSSSPFVIKVQQQVSGKLRLYDAASSVGEPFRAGEFSVNLLDYHVFELGIHCDVIPGSTQIERICVSNEHCLASIYNETQVIVWRLVGDEWRYDIKDCDIAIQNIVNYRDGFCVMDFFGRIILIGVNLDLKEIASPLSEPDEDELPDYYLYSSLSDVFLLSVCFRFGVKYNVYKLYEDVGRWVEVTNLDGRVLFRESNCHFFLSAGDFPWCYSNCIIRLPYVGRCQLYNLEEGSTQTIERSSYNKLFRPPDSWLMSDL